MHTFYKRYWMYLLFLMLVIGFEIVLSGCVADEDGFDILPNITLSVTSLEFSPITVESWEIRPVTINNPNNEEVIVERVTSTNQGFRVGGYYAGGRLIDLVVPFTIEGNGANILYVGFYPTEEKEYTGTLVIESRDANAEYERDFVDLRGIGLPDVS